MPESGLPVGGVTLRKYAALCLALGMARGALSGAIEEDDVQRAIRILDLTALAKIAEALECTEADLACIWDEHLSREEINRIEGWL